MRKLIGAIFLLAGGALAGREAAAQTRERSRTLSELADALERMEQELAFRLLPLPDLLRWVGEGSAGRVQTFLLGCAGKLGDASEDPFRRIWEEEMPALGNLGEEGERILRELGAVLGRCDAQGQCSALRRARSALELEAERAREEGIRTGRVRQTLCTAGGAILALLLF